ncbi:unnamed protein product [Gordionus sp. m RMFG-2023]
MATHICVLILAIWQLFNNQAIYLKSYPLDKLKTPLYKHILDKDNPSRNRGNLNFNVDEKYAIIIDAGSSGSRIFVYQYYFDIPPTNSNSKGSNPNNEDSNKFKGIPVDYLKIDLAKNPDNLNETLVHKISPGLSSFADNATISAEYLFTLIDSVILKIPASKLSGTPLYIMATAGMRLIEPLQQEAILSDCRRDIATKYPQLVFPPSHIQIISGTMEGVYAWIAINYILGKFDAHDDESILETKQTVGILDMGGASLQIAFQVPVNYSTALLGRYSSNLTDKISQAKVILNDSLLDIDIGGGVKSFRNYKLYVRTFLGFGANEIIDKYQHSLLSSQSNLSFNVSDPCYPTDYAYNISKASLIGTGDFVACYSKGLAPFLKLNAPCSLSPCSLAGAHSPPLFRFHQSRKLSRVALDKPNSHLSYNKLNDISSRLLHPQNLRPEMPDALFNGTANLSIPPLNNLADLSRSLDDMNSNPLSPSAHLKFYGFSEFWYSAHDILSMGGPYDPVAFKRSASAFCRKSWFELESIRSSYVNADDHRLTHQCLKSAWMYAVLHTGFGFPELSGTPDLFESVQLVKGKEAHWTLGAIIYALSHDRSYAQIAKTQKHSFNSNIAVSALMPVYPVQHIFYNQSVNGKPDNFFNPYVFSQRSEYAFPQNHVVSLSLRYNNWTFWIIFVLIILICYTLYRSCFSNFSSINKKGYGYNPNKNKFWIELAFALSLIKRKLKRIVSNTILDDSLKTYPNNNFYYKRVNNNECGEHFCR